MQAHHHGGNCSGHPSTHTTRTYQEALFLCNAHMMTALNASGYGVIYVSPPALIDFSRGEAVMRFDVSTLRTSRRDWWDIWISPLQDSIAMPFNQGDVDLNGVPRNAVHLEIIDANGAGTGFRPTIFRDHKATNEFPQFSSAWNWYTGYESVLTPSATVRETFELRLSRTHLKFGIPKYNLWWVDKDISSLPWGAGVVQIGHHSYTPLKDCTSPCSPNTWHWDNVRISPSIPLTTIRSTPRRVTNSTTPFVFDQPAPAGSFARFSAIGTTEVSFGGSTWQRLTPQYAANRRVEHMSNYEVAVPTGATRMFVRMTPDSWYKGPYQAKDLVVLKVR
jgi:hypothetical protein